MVKILSPICVIKFYNAVGESVTSDLIRKFHNLTESINQLTRNANTNIFLMINP